MTLTPKYAALRAAAEAAALSTGCVTANPSTLLSLLDRLEAAEERAERYRLGILEALKTAEDSWNDSAWFFAGLIRDALAAGDDRDES